MRPTRSVPVSLPVCPSLERLGVLGRHLRPAPRRASGGRRGAAATSSRSTGSCWSWPTDPGRKTGHRDITPAEDRLAMVAAAAAGLDRIEVSRLEIDRGGPSYTVDTVEELRRSSGPGETASRRRRGPRGEPADVGARRRAARLVTLADRDASGQQASGRRQRGGGRSRSAGSEVDVSSSEVRTRLSAGLPVDGLVPAPVVHYIARHGLYAVDR